MRFLLAIAVLASTFTGFAQGTSEAILGYDNRIGALVDTTVGWTFETSRSERAVQLGCFDYIFVNNPTLTGIQVGLWNNLGALLASNTITPSSTLFHETRYESITPVSLDPGQTYHLGVYFGGGALAVGIAGLVAEGSISNAPAILLRGMAQAGPGTGFSSPAELNGTLGSIFAAPNFRFDVPEPASWLLLSLGGLLLAARRRNQRR